MNVRSTTRRIFLRGMRLTPLKKLSEKRSRERKKERLGFYQIRVRLFRREYTGPFPISISVAWRCRQVYSMKPRVAKQIYLAGDVTQQSRGRRSTRASHPRLHYTAQSSPISAELHRAIIAAYEMHPYLLCNPVRVSDDGTAPSSRRLRCA